MFFKATLLGMMGQMPLSISEELVELSDLVNSKSTHVQLIHLNEKKKTNITNLPRQFSGPTFHPSGKVGYPLRLFNSLNTITLDESEYDLYKRVSPDKQVFAEPLIILLNLLEKFRL